MFLNSPKQEEGIIGRVAVSQFTIRPRQLPVICQTVCAMIRYIVYRAGAEGEVV